MMKRAAAFAWVVILSCVFLGMGQAENAIDFDFSDYNRSITYAQMIQVCRAPEDYAGKVFRLKGKFNYGEATQIARIIFSDSSGCCELAMQFIPEEQMVFPEDYPPLYSDIVITARLAFDADSPDMPCRFVSASVEW